MTSSTPSASIPSLFFSKDVSNQIQLVKFGGNQIDKTTGLISNCFGEFSLCDFKSREWKVMANENPKRTEFKLIQYKDALYSFAGSGRYINTVSNEISRYQLPIESGKTFQAIKTYCPSFLQRAAHSAVRYNHLVYIFGGWNGLETFGSLHIFNLENNELESATTNAKSPQDIPCPRRKHISVVYKDGLLIYGGYCEDQEKSSFTSLYRLDLKTHEWEKIDCCGDVPSARSRSDGVIHDNYMYMIGGWDRVTSNCEFYQLNLDTYLWTKIETNLGGMGIWGLQHHSVAVYKGWMYIVCGLINDSELTNRVFVTRLGFIGDLN